MTDASKCLRIKSFSELVCLWGALLCAHALALPTEAKALPGAVPTSENAYCSKGNVPEFGEKDGPAELPKTCFYTALAATPSPGDKIRVTAGSDLGDALEKARCGDTLLLAAGAGFPLREFPRKNCDDQHYITVRTEAADSDLPPEGTRISPAWAGVANLPGRPPYAQPAGGAAKRMAAIETLRTAGVEFGDHYRFIGIEWRHSSNKGIMRLLYTKGGDHLIFDRNWMHGEDGQEMVAGLGIAEGGVYVAVIHSYMSSFTCIARTGRCTDAKTIGGGAGDLPIHTIKVVDNYLEASGENILFGGSPGNFNPEDVEIRRNYFFKPTFWNPNSPDHREPTPIVKNLFELKSANRVLFEANYLENSWGGFSQVGAAIVLSPRNNVYKSTNVIGCVPCLVTNVTIRYVWVRKMNQLLQIANPQDSDKPAPGNHYSIHDVVAEGLRYPECGKACGGAQNQVSGGGAGMPAESVLHDVSVDHITFVSMSTPHTLFILNGPPASTPAVTQMYNISWTNTLADAGVNGANPTGGGPETNCASVPIPRVGPRDRLRACWKSGVFKGNVLAVGSNARPGAGDWPEGNFIARDQQSIGYVKLNNGLDGDYHLAASSKFRGKATDGKDPGADIDAVLGAVSGVR
ncbi:MAG: hypothetical protein WB562_15965 [Candidatus Sulfotelmatobacter sp.]